MIIPRRTLLIMGIISILLSTFGCSKLPEHKVDELTSLSISCGHMDRSFSYSFNLKKLENSWLLDADCFINQNEDEISLQECEISIDDIDELLKIVDDQQLIAGLESWKKPTKLGAATDESVYSSAMSFSDGTTKQGELHLSNDVENWFYRIAEKHTANN